MKAYGQQLLGIKSFTFKFVRVTFHRRHCVPRCSEAKVGAMTGEQIRRKEPNMPNSNLCISSTASNELIKKKPRHFFKSGEQTIEAPAAPRLQKSKIFWPVQNPQKQYQSLGKNSGQNLKFSGEIAEKSQNPLSTTTFSGMILNMTQYAVISKIHRSRLFIPASTYFSSKMTPCGGVESLDFDLFNRF